jgi:hypothetical protein
VLVDQGQPSHAGRRAPEQGWEPGRSMVSSGMTKRSDGIIAHHRRDSYGSDVVVRYEESA